MELELHHTSHEILTKVDKYGRRNGFLCFSGDVYIMTGSKTVYVHTIEIDKSEIIEASSLFYHEDAAKLDSIVLEVMSLADCDEDTAIAILRQKECDVPSAELVWELEGYTCACALALGYRGVSFQDEQGCCWMINMSGFESDMSVRLLD